MSERHFRSLISTGVRYLDRGPSDMWCDNLPLYAPIKGKGGPLGIKGGPRMVRLQLVCREVAAVPSRTPNDNPLETASQTRIKSSKAHNPLTRWGILPRNPRLLFPGFSPGLMVPGFRASGISSLWEPLALPNSSIILNLSQINIALEISSN